MDWNVPTNKSEKEARMRENMAPRQRVPDYAIQGDLDPRPPPNAIKMPWGGYITPDELPERMAMYERQMRGEGKDAREARRRYFVLKSLFDKMNAAPAQMPEMGGGQYQQGPNMGGSASGNPMAWQLAARRRVGL